MADEQSDRVLTNEEIIAFHTEGDRVRYLALLRTDERFRYLAESAKDLKLPTHPSYSGDHKGLKPNIHTGDWVDFAHRDATFSASCPKGEECGNTDPYSFALIGGIWVVNK